MKTGITIVPSGLPTALRITRPTAWMMSTIDRLGSMNAMPSSTGTSTPSPRQAQFERMPRVSSGSWPKPFSNVARWPAGVWPEMCVVQSFMFVVPPLGGDRRFVPPKGGTTNDVMCAITPGKESRRVASTNRAAFATDEWNVISFRRSYFRIALAKPICAASVRAFLGIAEDKRSCGFESA